MRLKFWEHRSSIEPTGSYTTDVLNYLSARVSGQALQGVPAAIEICAGVWQRGMASAEVSPINARTAALTPSMLGYIGRHLLLRGELVLELGVSGGQITLTPAQSWLVTGGVDPATWEYEITLQGPNRYEVRVVPADRVLHLMYATAHDAPWRGTGPLVEAGLTQDMVVAMEAALAQEASTPTAYVVPVPDPKQSGQLTTDLRSSRGSLSLVPSVRSDASWGQGSESSQGSDWQSMRLGMMPPMAMIELRSRSELSILAAAGVPTTIMSTSDGTAKKEDFRRFLHLTLAPVGRIVAQQIGDALDVPGLAFDFSGIGAADIAAKARAYGTLTKSGVSPLDAGEPTGLPIDDTTTPPAPAQGPSDG